MSVAASDPVTQLLAEHPCSTANEVALAMTEQLDVALHGCSTARPASPREAWAELLAEVERSRQ